MFSLLDVRRNVMSEIPWHNERGCRSTYRVLRCGLWYGFFPPRVASVSRNGGYDPHSYHTPWLLTSVLCRMLDLLVNRLSLRDPLRPLGVRLHGGGSSATSVPQILPRGTGDHAMGPTCAHRRSGRIDTQAWRPPEGLAISNGPRAGLWAASCNCRWPRRRQ